MDHLRAVQDLREEDERQSVNTIAVAFYVLNRPMYPSIHKIYTYEPCFNQLQLHSLYFDHVA